METIRESAGASLTLRCDLEARTLREWAQKSGLTLDPFDYLVPARQGGEEHLILRDARSDRVIKLTRANAFGFTVDAEWFLDDEAEEAEIKPALRGATPLEYLERLLLHNELFADDIELLGIIDKRQALHVVTSQPTIRGDAASPAQIAEFMHSLGFALLPPLPIGRQGAASFLRTGDSVAAFDCHSENFLVSDDHVFPIDVVVLRTDDALLSALPTPAS